MLPFNSWQRMSSLLLLGTVKISNFIVAIALLPELSFLKVNMPAPAGKKICLLQLSKAKMPFLNKNVPAPAGKKISLLQHSRTKIGSHKAYMDTSSGKSALL